MRHHFCPTCSRPIVPTPDLPAVNSVFFCSRTCHGVWYRNPLHNRRTQHKPVQVDRRQS